MVAGTFCVYRSLLLMGLLTGLGWMAVAAAAVQPPKSDQAPAADPQAVQLKSATPAEFGKFADSLAGRGLWISRLSTRVHRGSQVFDATAEPNTGELAWFVHANLTADEFAEKQKTYSADGFVLRASQILTMRPRKLHLGLWTQDTEAKVELQLPAGNLPESGNTGATLEPLNALFREFLQQQQVPGATVAVSRDGKVLYERAFGWASVDHQTPMQPDTELRIASISKPLTSVAVLQLEAAGKLSLDAPVLPLLAQHSEGFPTAQAIRADPRWADIQVRHLLQHTAGFDREKSKDTMFELVTIAASLKLERPPNVNDIVRYQLQQPLDFAPGSEFQYSNVGYCLLGRIIEAVSQTSYEDFVRQHILIPSGMQQTRLGKTRLEQRGDREAVYVARNRRRIPLVFDLLKRPRTETQLVETPWGQWDLEVMDAHGGWVSTAGDLVRFAEAMSASENSLLQEKSLQLMLQRPALPEQSTAPTWYGLGWNVRGLAEVRKSNLWHTGLLSGTSSLLVRRWDDCCWAVLFNCDRTKSEQPCTATIDGPMHGAVDQSLQLLPAQP